MLKTPTQENHTSNLSRTLIPWREFGIVLYFPSHSISRRLMYLADNFFLHNRNSSWISNPALIHSYKKIWFPVPLIIFHLFFITSLRKTARLWRFYDAIKEIRVSSAYIYLEHRRLVLHPSCRGKERKKSLVLISVFNWKPTCVNMLMLLMNLLSFPLTKCSIYGNSMITPFLKLIPITLLGRLTSQSVICVLFLDSLGSMHSFSFAKKTSSFKHLFSPGLKTCTLQKKPKTPHFQDWNAAIIGNWISSSSK